MESLGFLWIRGRSKGRRTRPQKRLWGQRPGGQKDRQPQPRQRDCTHPVRDPHETVLDHGVAAAVLGGIEGGIGGLDQVARPLRASLGMVQATPTLTVTLR